MKQIYDFEQYNAPVLNGNMLRQEQEKRRVRRQTALLALAGILFQVVVVMLGYSAIDWYPWLATACLGYVVLSTTACGVIAVAYSHRGGFTV